MLNTSLVRPAEFRDQQSISNLIFFEARVHRHLDWRSPLDWLGTPFFWVLEEEAYVTAALACPQEMQGIAWLRLFAYGGRWSPQSAWDSLWNTAHNELARAGGSTVAVIATQPWFQSILRTSGFVNRQHIVLLEWQCQPWSAREANAVRIRPMNEADLPRVSEVDGAAFDPLWQISLKTLRQAYAQAAIVTVVEDGRDMIGYQLSTRNARGAHLARLAVHPDAQGRDIGTMLLSDLFFRLWQRGITRLSVNTQHDNQASLALYQKMGFLRTGEQFPVFTLEIPAKG